MSFGSLPSVLGNGGGVAISVIGGTGLFADGTAAAPSISFAADIDLGVYRISTNVLGFACGGVGSWQMYNSGGTNYLQSSGTNGLYTKPAGEVGLYAGGTNQNITLLPSGTGFVSIPSLNYDLSSASFSAEIKYAGAFSAGRGGSLGLGGTYDGSNSTLFAGIAGVKESAVSGETGGTLTFHSRSNAGAISERARILSTGRFLLGTTTDSSALLQIGTNTTTSAGGMVFGTDTFLYRSAAGMATLLSASNYPLIVKNSVGTLAAAIVSQNTGGDFYIGTDSNDGSAIGSGVAYAGVLQVTGSRSLILRTNSATALTLDASQNATFAGTVKTKASILSAINEVNVSTTATDIAIATTSVGGLYFVTGYNMSGGAQGSWLLMARGANVTTISSDNNTGLAVTYSMSAGKLQAATASGTIALITTAITR